MKYTTIKIEVTDDRLKPAYATSGSQRSTQPTQAMPGVRTSATAASATTTRTTSSEPEQSAESKSNRRPASADF